MNKRTIIICITVILSLAEGFITYKYNLVSVLSNFATSIIGKNNSLLDFLSLITPAGLIFLINYYIFAPCIYFLFRAIWRVIGHYEHILKKTNTINIKCINWLLSCKKHWGDVQDANICLHANTCEGLLALRKSDMHRKKSEAYKNSLLDVLNSVEVDGVPSKSLKRATVVCTAMFLYLVGLEKEDSIGVITEYATYNALARKLWSIRNFDKGWGVFVEHSEDNCCSLANTYWALRALCKYDICRTSEFQNYLSMIYEYNNNGCFGFYVGDESRLATTAMYLCLYYEMPAELRNCIEYNPKNAASYIYKKFVKEEVEVETESLYGINKNNTGVKQVPWNHVVVGYCVDALANAYAHFDFSTLEMDVFMAYLDSLLSKHMVINDNYAYYMPRGLQHKANKVFTYPTSYMVCGISSLSCIRKRRRI